MVGANHANLDRQLDVELLGDFRQQLDLLELQAAAQTGAGDVLEQAGHLGIARQLAQQSAERLLHLHHLLAIGLQIGCLTGLGGELLPERLLLTALLVQLRLQVLEVEVVTQRQHRNQQQDRGDHLDRSRPGAEVVGVQLAEIDLAQTFQGLSQTHFLAPPCWATA
ncbi:hypothetical protein D3C75_708210 [compost metagenome]